MKSKNLRYNPVRIVRKDYCCSWSWPGSAEHWKTLRLSNNAKTARSAKTTRLIFKNIAKNVQTFKSQIFHRKRKTEKKIINCENSSNFQVTNISWEKEYRKKKIIN